MTNGGDAAEQIVRLSLEGVEVAAKITGEAARDITALLISVLNQEHKTKGKARLSQMIKSGKELKVFSIKQRDLKKFTQEAKKYGVLYTVLRDKTSKNENTVVDIIARAEDASKIQRITERFNLSSVDKAEIVSNAEKNIEQSKAKDVTDDNRSNTDSILEEIFADGSSESKSADIEKTVNPTTAKTEKSPPSELYSDKAEVRVDKGTAKESVREKLNGYKARIKKQKEAVRTSPAADEKTKVNSAPAVTEHQPTKINIKKSKER